MFVEIFKQRRVHLIKKYAKQLRGCPITLFYTCIGIKTMLFLSSDTNYAFIIDVHVTNYLHQTLWYFQFHCHVFPQGIAIYPIVSLIQVYKNKPKRRSGTYTVLYQLLNNERLFNSGIMLTKTSLGGSQQLVFVCNSSQSLVNNRHQQFSERG